MFFEMQKTDFHELELFCRASYVRASMHKITSLASKSTNVLLVKKANEETTRPEMLKSFFLSERKLFYATLRVRLAFVKTFLSNEIKC